MSSFAADREEERQRNNEWAERLAARGLGPDGADAIDPLLRQPYLTYEALVCAAAGPGKKLLDVCGGDGLHSLCGARQGAVVTVADISAGNLALAIRRAARAGVTIRTVEADAEAIPVPDASFDVVTCAGGLSYVDLDRFLTEVNRILLPDGTFIFVDSLNHNPIYRLNRYWHYRRGNRSRATLVRMPTLRTLARVQEHFPDLRLSFHGIFSFAAPVLRWCAGSHAARWLDAWDLAFPMLRRYAFKVVGTGRLSQQTANLKRTACLRSAHGST